jgi:hypothetical protein
MAEPANRRMEAVRRHLLLPSPAPLRPVGAAVPPDLDFPFAYLIFFPYSPLFAESVKQPRGGGAQPGDHWRDGAGYPCQAFRAAPSWYHCPWNGACAFTLLVLSLVYDNRGIIVSRTNRP